MDERRRLRIASVYTLESGSCIQPNRMSLVRWLRMSEALARRGYQVDILSNYDCLPLIPQPRLRAIPLHQAKWADYDVVKTLYQQGLHTLMQAGGAGHPFVLSRIASVVGRESKAGGLNFDESQLRVLRSLESLIPELSRGVIVDTETDARFWRSQYNGPEHVLVVPTGTDRIIPPPGENPYARFRERIAVFIGSLRGLETYHPNLDSEPGMMRVQQSLNRTWQQRLNALGRNLCGRGIRLCHVGPGDTTLLDADAVTALGPVDVNHVWNYHYFAAVGISLAIGDQQRNESSRIYYYLRAGLPVVSEQPIPNNSLIRKTNLGFIAPYGDEEKIAELVEEAIGRRWDKEKARRYLADHHSWDHRAGIYDQFIRRQLRSDQSDTDASGAFATSDMRISS